MPKFSKTRILTGPGPAAGLWHIVGDVRGADTTQVAKKLFAKFVVTTLNQTFGAAGTDTEILVDTTCSNDTIYKIQHQVLVNSGTTLTIQTGTLILAKGQNAVLVIEKGVKIIADGRRELPILLTCDAPVSDRFFGCWAGLIVLGDAPITRGTGLAEGEIPETHPQYGGSNPMDSSGMPRYVRVEFAGADFNPETQPMHLDSMALGSER